MPKKSVSRAAPIHSGGKGGGRGGGGGKGEREVGAGAFTLSPERGVPALLPHVTDETVRCTTLAAWMKAF